MSTRVVFRISDEDHKRLKAEAKFLHISMSKLARSRVLGQPLPTVVFSDDEQYTNIQRQFHGINQALSDLGVTVQSERTNIIGGLYAKAYAKFGDRQANLKVAQALLNDSNSVILKKLLASNEKKVYPKLCQISKQVIKLEHDFSRQFD